MGKRSLPFPERLTHNGPWRVRAGVPPPTPAVPGAVALAVSEPTWQDLMIRCFRFSVWFVFCKWPLSKTGSGGRVDEGPG